MIVSKSEWIKIGRQVAKQNKGSLYALCMNDEPNKLVFVIIVDGQEKQVEYLVK